jgi:hypothetical protein
MLFALIHAYWYQTQFPISAAARVIQQQYDVCR